MPTRPSNDPDDPNVTAHRIVSQATRDDATGPELLADLIRDVQAALDDGRDPDSIAELLWPRVRSIVVGTITTSDAAAEMARQGASKGGKARAKKLSAEQRSSIARRAAHARWGKTQDD